MFIRKKRLDALKLKLRSQEKALRNAEAELEELSESFEVAMAQYHKERELRQAADKAAELSRQLMMAAQQRMQQLQGDVQYWKCQCDEYKEMEELLNGTDNA